MWFRRRTVLWASTRSAHHMTVWWYVFCRILRGSLCSNVDGERSYFLCTLMANKLVCNDVFLTCVSRWVVWFYARFAVPVCSLFRGRFWCHFDVNLWVKFLLFRRLFVSFSEPLPTYYRVRNKRHLSAHFMMCSTKWRRRSTHTHTYVQWHIVVHEIKSSQLWCEQSKNHFIV